MASTTQHFGYRHGCSLARLTLSSHGLSSDERQFFVTLGERIAQMRKARSITQVQLAEALGVSQQTVYAYEAGSRRIPVSALPVVASTLAVSLEVLFGEEHTKSGRSKRGPVPQRQQHIEAVSLCPSRSSSSSCA